MSILRNLLRSAVFASAVVACADQPPADESFCTDCVSQSGSVTLDFRDAPTLPSLNGLLARNTPRTTYAFVDRRVPYEILIFDADGRFERRLGRQGDGPGEYQEISGIAFGSSDSLWVVSRGGTQVTVYTPDLTLARTASHDVAIGRIRQLSRGAMLIGTVEEGRARLAQLGNAGVGPVLWGDTARAVSAFGGVSAMASDGEGRFWFARPHAYEIFEGDGSGGIANLVDASPSWFQETYSEAIIDRFGGRIDTGGATILLLDFNPTNGLLWVVSGVPNSGLGVEELSTLLELPAPEATEIVPMMLDHVVEARDPANGRLRATERFDYLPISHYSPLQYRRWNPTTLEVLEFRVQTEDG